MFQRAVLLIQDDFKAFKAKQPQNSNVLIFSVPSSNCEIENANEKFYKALVKMTWTTFDEFIVHGYQKFYIVKFDNENWKVTSSCTCACFFKQHMCKHILAIGIKVDKIRIPPTINPVLLAATRRKAGRPRKTAKALALQ